MANIVFKSASVYYGKGGRKVAEISGHTVSIDSGDEDQFGADGWLGASDGQTMMTLDCDMVVPHDPGLSIPVLADMLDKQYVDIGIHLEGKMLAGQFRCVSIKYTSDSKVGSLRCTATFRGPKPTVSAFKSS